MTTKKHLAPSNLTNKELLLIFQNARNGWDTYSDEYLANALREWYRRRDSEKDRDKKRKQGALIYSN